MGDNGFGRRRRLDHYEVGVGPFDERGLAAAQQLPATLRHDSESELDVDVTAEGAPVGQVHRTFQHVAAAIRTPKVADAVMSASQDVRAVWFDRAGTPPRILGTAVGGSIYHPGMTTFHAFLGCSLDGFIAGPRGELDWLIAFDEKLSDTGYGYETFFASIDALAMGRASYEAIRSSNPGFYGGTPVHVLSRSLTPGPHPAMGSSSITVHPDIATLRASLSAAGAERVYVDGGRTVQAFLAAELLADIVITRVPVLIGEGIPLFGPVPAPVQAELIESRVLDAGAVQSVYRFPARSL